MCGFMNYMKLCVAFRKARLKVVKVAVWRFLVVMKCVAEDYFWCFLIDAWSEFYSKFFFTEYFIMSCIEFVIICNLQWFFREKRGLQFHFLTERRLYNKLHNLCSTKCQSFLLKERCKPIFTIIPIKDPNTSLTM